ncbi:MAG: hypothetical protein H0Z28_09185 [Archaeoglobus sp.]|nr:hypothetical protein [Archaeoglobus sp.]
MKPTNRIGLNVLLCLTLFFLLLTTASALTVKIQGGSGAVGSEASLAISVKDAKNLGSMDLVIAYDPEILKVKKVEKGSLVKGLFSSNTEKAGVIAIGIVDSKGINGDGEIAKITFEVLKAGESSLEVANVKAYDVESHVDIQVTAENGVFKAEKAEEASTQTPTPTPTPEEKKSPGFEIGIAVAGLVLALFWRKGGLR